MNLDPNDLAYALGKPTSFGEFKHHPADFKVDEQLSFELSGEGEHLFLCIEKQNLTTEELIKRLSRSLNKPPKLISHAGLKDRQAITTQWLSVHCPGEEINLSALPQDNNWRIIKSCRHLKKLKVGGLSSNQFQIILRNVTEKEAIEERLHHVQHHGVPNYFGPQRFGLNGQNLIRAQGFLLDNQRVKDRFLRGIYYSAARSFLFNRILSSRVAAGNWHQAIPGDVMQLQGSHSIFPIDTPDEIIKNRVEQHDISPASILYGKGSELTRLDAYALQKDNLEPFQSWCDALEAHGLEKAYRAHILSIQTLYWKWQEDALFLSFELPPGAYATSVLRELTMTITS